jgi:murein DD-endopeptidase MepM/ murein hydrolase activator NlpD
VLVLSLFASIVGFAPPASAAPNWSTLPDFKLPFQCGEQWRLSTYSGHAIPDKQVDFFRVDGGVDFGIVEGTKGAPVLAAAAGRVHEVYSPGGVEIDHGGGWFTQYLHMTGITVGVGQSVWAGQKIGTVGAVGTDTAHLHFELMYDSNGDGDGDGPPDDPVWETEYPWFEGRQFVLKVRAPEDDPRVTSTNACAGGGGPQGMVQYGKGLYIFSREQSTNDLVLERYNGSWTRQTWGASLTGQPAATVYNNQLQVVGRESNGTLRRWWYDPVTATWNTGTLPGSAGGDPDIATFARTNQLQVVARNGSNQLWQWWYTPGQGWANGAIPLTSDIAIAGTPAIATYSVKTQWVEPLAPGHFQVIARATDNKIWMWRYDAEGGGWARAQIPGAATGNPSVAVYNNQLHVLVRGTDNRLWHLYRTTATKWSSEVFPGLFPAGAAAITIRDNQFHLLVRNTASALIHFWYEGGWTGETLPLGASGEPDATVYSDPSLTGWHWGQLQVAARGTDGRLRTWWAGPGEPWSTAPRVSYVA